MEHLRTLTNLTNRTNKVIKLYQTTSKVLKQQHIIVKDCYLKPKVLIFNIFCLPDVCLEDYTLPLLKINLK